MTLGLHHLYVESTQEYEVELIDRVAELSEAGWLDAYGWPDERDIAIDQKPQQAYF